MQAEARAAEGSEEAEEEEEEVGWRVVEAGPALSERAAARTAAANFHDWDYDEAYTIQKGEEEEAEDQAEEAERQAQQLEPAAAAAGPAAGELDVNRLLDRHAKLSAQLSAAAAAVAADTDALAIDAGRLATVTVFLRAETAGGAGASLSVEEEERQVAAINTFVYGQLPIEQMEVVPKLMKMLYLEHEAEAVEAAIEQRLAAGLKG